MIASVRLQRPALSVPYWGMAAHAGPSEPRSGDESHDIDVVHTTYTPKEDRVGAAAAAPAVAATDAVGAAAPQPGNFVRDAQPGCHVAFSASALSYVRSAPGASAAAVAAIAAAGGSGGAARDASSSHGCGHGAAHPETPQLEAPPTWIVGSSPFDPDDYGLDEDEISSVPDLSLDPESGLLACLNTSTKVRSYFLSLGHPCRDVSGELLSVGSARDSDGRVSPVVTIVAVLGPHETMELCYVDVSARLAAASGGGSGGAGGGGKSRKARRRRKQKAKAAASADAGDGEVDLYSDVQDVDFSSILKAARSGACAALDGGLPVVGWPLAARELAGEGGGVALSCSQGCGGSFTHFFPGTYHAVDIACPIGTPCVAVGDGEVVRRRAVSLCAAACLRQLSPNAMPVRVARRSSRCGRTTPLEVATRARCLSGTRCKSSLTVGLFSSTCTSRPDPPASHRETVSWPGRRFVRVATSASARRLTCTCRRTRVWSPTRPPSPSRSNETGSRYSPLLVSSMSRGYRPRAAAARKSS